MHWPLFRPLTPYRREAQEAHREAGQAKQAKEASTARRQLVEVQAIAADNQTAAMRAELNRNGWTALLQKAWGPR